MEIGAFEGVIIGIVILGAYHWGRLSMLSDIVRELKEKGVLPKDLSLKQDASDSESDDEIIKLEQHHGLYYAFGDNDRFLAQGADFDALFTQIKQRFPNQTFRVHKESMDEAEFGRVSNSIFKIFGDRK